MCIASGDVFHRLDGHFVVVIGAKHDVAKLALANLFDGLDVGLVDDQTSLDEGVDIDVLVRVSHILFCLGQLCAKTISIFFVVL